MKFKIKEKLCLGQSLVEVVVSIGIAVILAISLITTSLITQKSSRSARNNSQATKLVQETIEQIRVFRDRSGFSALPSAPTATCFTFDTTNSDPTFWQLSSNADCNATLLTISLDNTNFTRKIEMINHNTDVNKRLITVTASWDESGQTRSVKSQTILGLWQDFP